MGINPLYLIEKSYSVFMGRFSVFTVSISYKYLGDSQTICSTGFGFLSLTKYENFVCQSKMYEKWTKQMNKYDEYQD